MISLEIDYEDPSNFEIQFMEDTPLVVLGSGVFEHAGLEREVDMTKAIINRNFNEKK